MKRGDVHERAFREVLAPRIEALEAERNIRLCFGAAALVFLIFLSAGVVAALAVLLPALVGDWGAAPICGLMLLGIPFGLRLTFRRRRKEKYIPPILKALGWDDVSYFSKSLMRRSQIKSVVPHGWFDRVDGEDSLCEVRPTGRYTFCEASRSRLVLDSGGWWRRERISHGWILHAEPARGALDGVPMGLLRLDPEGGVRGGEAAIPLSLGEPLRDLMRLAGVDAMRAFPFAGGIGYAIVTERDLFEDIGNINEEFHQTKGLRLIEEIDGVAGAAARLLDALASRL